MNGKDGPDVDLRYIKKPMSLVGISQDTVRSDIVSFLSSLYDSVAETLPDVRDTAFDGIEAADIPSIGHMDSCCIELNRQSAENFEEADENHISTRRRSLLFPHAKGKAKPRKKRKALELNMDRTHGPGAKDIKFLPPGFMKEYYQQYRMVSSLEKPASFPSFWRAPWLELCEILKSLGLGRESHIAVKRFLNQIIFKIYLPSVGQVYAFLCKRAQPRRHCSDMANKLIIRRKPIGSAFSLKDKESRSRVLGSRKVPLIWRLFKTFANRAQSQRP